MFPEFQVYHRRIARSNHMALLLCMAPWGVKCGIRNNFRFKFMWLRNESCKRAIKKAWKSDGLGRSKHQGINQKCSLPTDKME